MVTPVAAPVAVVTGGADGIGWAVAARLARRGHRLVLLAHEAPSRTGPPSASHPSVPHSSVPSPSVPRWPALSGEAALVTADLAETASVRAAAGALLDACPRLDVLVHAAAVRPARRQLTSARVERAFAVNHLAPFLLNHLLEERLRESGARVVQVCAGSYAGSYTGSYAGGRADPGRTWAGLDFHPARTHADTLLCALMMVPLFARRWRDAGVTIDAVDPGAGGVAGQARTRRDGGADRVVRLALDASGGTGRYFEAGTETPPAPVARDAALAERLWRQAVALTLVS